MFPAGWPRRARRFPAPRPSRRRHVLCYIHWDDTRISGGVSMKRRSIVFAVAGLIIGGAWFVGASAIRAQQPAQQPAPAPTQAVPPIGPPDPNLRTVPLPSGKKVHLLPATLETTQWAWFDNPHPPLLPVHSAD